MVDMVDMVVSRWFATKRVSEWAASIASPA